MTKKELLESIGCRIDSIVSSKKDVEAVLDAVVDSVITELSNGNDVTLSGLGTFKVKQRKARNGRNPKTGQTVKIAAKKALTFKASTTIKKDLN